MRLSRNITFSFIAFEVSLACDMSLSSGPSQGEYFAPRSAHRARVTLTAFESAVFDRATENCLIDEFVFTVCSIPRCVRDSRGPWVVIDNIPSAMRNGKTVITNFTQCVIVAFWRPQCMAISQYMSHISAVVYSKLEVRFLRFVYRSASPSLILKKNMTPSGDISRDHHRQHCQYRLRGLRCIVRGLASSIINRNMHISNRWPNILNARYYRYIWYYMYK